MFQTTGRYKSKSYRKLQTSRYKIFRTIENAQVNQEELLVTGNMKQHKKYVQ